MPVNMKVENTGSNDAFVTVWDLNTANSDILLKEERINSGEFKPVTCELDGNGDANLKWQAEKADDRTIVESEQELIRQGDHLEVYV